MVDTKVCTKCGEEKSFSEYNKQKGAKFGVSCYCKSCQKIYLKKYRQENRERLLKYYKKYRQENREVLLESSRIRSKKNYQKNKSAYRRRLRERRGVVKQRTPDWLTPIDNIVMNHIYATCPEGYHVDHIVPLKSDKVSGLNVPWNLQHLPAEENIAKGNRYWPDMWEYDDG